MVADGANAEVPATRPRNADVTRFVPRPISVGGRRLRWRRRVDAGQDGFPDHLLTSGTCAALAARLASTLKGLVMINKILCASILTFVVTAAAFDVAQARTDYDGTWTLSVETQSGDCAPTYQFQVQIVDGVVSYQGPARVEGRVSTGGAVSVSVATETQRGSGSGKLTRGSGRGRWSGRSSTQRCSGAWTAQRY
jgi:hypothetical protein